jgi:hypothetical protein
MEKAAEENVGDPSLSVSNFILLTSSCSALGLLHNARKKPPKPHLYCSEAASTGHDFREPRHACCIDVDNRRVLPALRAPRRLDHVLRAVDSIRQRKRRMAWRHPAAAARRSAETPARSLLRATTSRGDRQDTTLRSRVRRKAGVRSISMTASTTTASIRTLAALPPPFALPSPTRSSPFTSTLRSHHATFEVSSRSCRVAVVFGCREWSGHDAANGENGVATLLHPPNRTEHAAQRSCSSRTQIGNVVQPSTELVRRALRNRSSSTQIRVTRTICCSCSCCSASAYAY